MVDANVLLAGTGWPRFAYEVLQHALRQDFQLVLPQYVIDEAHEHIGRILGAEYEKNLNVFLTECQYEMVSHPTLAQLEVNRTLIRDIDDLPVALAAIDAEVDFFISQDKDFTDPQNTALHEKLVVLLPGTFLRTHMGWSSEALEAIRYRTWEQLISPPSE
jgi:predicted nucleic acid-binding protein